MNKTRWFLFSILFFQYCTKLFCPVFELEPPCGDYRAPSRTGHVRVGCMSVSPRPPQPLVFFSHLEPEDKRRPVAAPRLMAEGGEEEHAEGKDGEMPRDDLEVTAILAASTE
ncbi:hypothetical protein HN446_04915 [bacterium]|jgi:hypothetical protein|nr:hypothetical protein [bacterium]